MMRETTSASCSSRPGGGTAVWRTWKSRSKSGSSTQNGWSWLKGTSTSRRRSGSSEWRRHPSWALPAAGGPKIFDSAGEGRSMAVHSELDRTPSGLFFRVTGGQRPLVLLHGLLVSGAMFDPLVSLMRDDFNVIVPDLRGHGASNTMPGPY